VSIIISGASGAYGRMISERLLNRLPPEQLILVTRKPEKLVDLASRGAQVRFGDFDDAESLRKAFAGGERLLLISTLDVGERRQHQHRAAIVQAMRAGVKHIVYTSSTGIHPRSPAFVIADHLYTEELLRDCGAAFTFLRDSHYADVVVKMMAPVAIASGKWITSTGEGRVAWVSKQDCVAAAEVVLTTGGHEGAVYEITGPELLTMHDAARLAAEVSGHTVEFVNVSHDEMQAHFDAAGVPRKYVEGVLHERSGAWASEEMMSYERAIREGYFAVCAHHVQLLTGRPAQSLRDLFEANRALLKRGGGDVIE
jgi:NAD(P)H dehydrogenase (quinone)